MNGSEESRGTESRARIVAAAQGWIGTPYMHQASLKGVGCDCLGLLRGVWREVFGDEPLTPPPYTPDWSEASGEETLAKAAAALMDSVSPCAAEASDVLLFRWRDHLPAKHCAVLSAPDRMIHAHNGAAVAEVSLGPWWRRHVAFAFRFRIRD
jgi:NlpC/P60 family putative phage cell wall peptidase